MGLHSVNSRFVFCSVSVRYFCSDLFQGAEEEKTEIQYTNDILAMLSPEGEKVGLGKGLKARGNVEDWLGKVEDAMFTNLRRLTKSAISDFEQNSREDWIMSHCSQVVLTVSQLIWCREVTEILSGDNQTEDLKAFEQQSFKDLNVLAGIVRGELPKLARAVLCALITIDVHARDMVTSMVENQVRFIISFVNFKFVGPCDQICERFGVWNFRCAVKRISNGKSKQDTTGTRIWTTVLFACPIRCTCTAMNILALQLDWSSLRSRSVDCLKSTLNWHLLPPTFTLTFHFLHILCAGSMLSVSDGSTAAGSRGSPSRPRGNRKDGVDQGFGEGLGKAVCRLQLFRRPRLQGGCRFFCAVLFVACDSFVACDN